MSIVKIDVRKLSFINDGKINIRSLVTALTSIIQDAEKSNKGNGASGRRFRLNTVAISKAFLDMRTTTPVK